jgi:hypothetical protein
MSTVYGNAIFIHDGILVAYTGTLYHRKGKILFDDGVYTMVSGDRHPYDRTGCMV